MTNVMNDDLNGLIRLMTDGNYAPAFGPSVEYNNYRYSVTLDANMIIAIDNTNGLIRKVCSLSGEDSKQWLVGSVFLIEHFLGILPYNSKRFHLVDLDTEEEIVLEQECVEGNQYLRCSKYLIMSNDIWFVQCEGNYIYKLNINEKKVEKCIDIKEIIEKKYKKKIESIAMSASIVHEEKIYLFLNEIGAVAVFDIKVGDVSFIDVGDSGFAQAVLVGNDFYVVERSGMIYKLQHDPACYIKLFELPPIYRNRVGELQKSFCLEEKVFFLSPRKEWGLVFDIGNGSVITGSFHDILGVNEERDEHLAITSVEDKLICFVTNYSRLIKFDIVNHITSYQKLYTNIDFWN